jgi:hypothetical protein
MGESNETTSVVVALLFVVFVDEVVSDLLFDVITRFFFTMTLEAAALVTSDSTVTMVEDVLSSRVTFGFFVTLASGWDNWLMRTEPVRLGRKALEDKGESSCAMLQKGARSSVSLEITVLIRQNPTVRSTIFKRWSS